MTAQAIENVPNRDRTYWMRQTSKSRAKIQASRLIDRLQAFATGDTDKANGDKVEMSNAQVRAALGLLAKVIPDLKESDVHHHQAEPTTPTAMITQLKALLGDEQAGQVLERIGYKRQTETATDAVIVTPVVHEANEEGSL